MEANVEIAKYPWLKNYPIGVPHQINPDAYTSLAELMEEAFQKYSDRPAFTCMGKQITFHELDTLTQQFAAYLQSIGLQKGDRVAIQMPNLLQYPIAMYGALRAGLIVVNTNPLYTPREMEHQFKDSGAKAIVIVANFVYNLEKIIKNTAIKHVIITNIGDMLGFPKKQIVNFVVKSIKKMVPAYHLPEAVSFSDALAKGSQNTFKRVEIKNSDLAYIQYTGGTTGISKGAMLTHRNMIANLEQTYHWMGSGMDLKACNIIVTALPLYHIYSLTVNANLGLKTGMMNLLITNPRDMKGYLKEISKYPFTMITGVNTLYNGMLNHADFSKVNFSHLKIASAGGMALQNAVLDKWKSVTGTVIAEGYGLSETSPVLSSNCVNGTIKAGTIGLPFPSTEMKTVKEDGTDAVIGERGEIWAKGPQVMPGYWNRPDETEKVMEDGWFKTGDIGIMDEEGYFKIVDRKKDMILVSGFNVYPNEIEDVVASHPKVLEVAAIGVPDAKTTESVKIFVVKKDPSLTVEELQAYCRENLTAYKCPRHVEFRTELPKSNVGKIIRRMLRDTEVAKS
ncbi:AMP-binding protein [Xanthocytophaga flava]|uniref:AMP-binding protein n=1 Tax=Xanthocytophaga flava TaxID=3048013 RepID=UPI0028D0DACE|nr:AMP-binding protein [Xanthocytophaga flavus]MDJ1470934.1 AMP-binding protein [Xanthocytophaga flavus]